MILFFRTKEKSVIATDVDHKLTPDEVNELCWLYGDAEVLSGENLTGQYVGPRREMVTPWSTNAVEITQNMGLRGISRIEEYFPVTGKDADHDPMLQRLYYGLNQDIFTIHHQPAPIEYVENLEAYNEQEGLALSPEEIGYLHHVEEQLGRKLTDSEVFGFAQINSEHCRHKIFGGTFIIDGKERESSLFNLIKKTTKENPHRLSRPTRTTWRLPKVRLWNSLHQQTIPRAIISSFATLRVSSLSRPKRTTSPLPLNPSTVLQQERVEKSATVWAVALALGR